MCLARTIADTASRILIFKKPYKRQDMFSSEKNIESIATLIEETKKYVALRVKLAKFDIIEKVVRIITALTLTFVLLLLLVLLLIYLSFAAAYAISEWIDSYVIGFLSVALFYFFIFILVICKRKSWIERPLVRFLASILLD